MSYCKNCPRNCASFREHVGNGPMISATATPTRSIVNESLKTHKQWETDGAAAKRLMNDGVPLQQIDGAADFERKATTDIERQTGRLFGDQAKTVQYVADGGTA